MSPSHISSHVLAMLKLECQLSTMGSWDALDTRGVSSTYELTRAKTKAAYSGSIVLVTTKVSDKDTLSKF